MSQKFLRNLQFLLATLDLLVINTLFFVYEILLSKQIAEDNIQYIYLGLFVNVAWLAATITANLYHEKYILSFELFSKRTLLAFTYFVTIVIFYLFFFRQLNISRIFTLIVLGSIPMSLLFNRFVYLLIYRYFKNNDYLVQKVIIVGYNELSKKLVSYLEDGKNKKVIGFCEEYESVKELSNYPILSNIKETLEVSKLYGATEIYSTIAPEHNSAIYQLMHKADQNCIHFKIIPDLGFFIKRQIHIDYLREIPILSLRKEPLEDLTNRIKKRFFDIIFSLFVMIFLLSWIIPIISLLIRLESKGPIFFVQERTGKDNKSFRCLKFRSMRVNNKANELQASKNDIRITKIGRFLRRSNLDELPQFINVFIGTMSIVGPRPHMLKHTNDYSKLINQYMVRQFLKPGITGWAQVNGLRGETKTVAQMQKRVEHDLWYLENWNFWLDIKIVFMTCYNVIKGDKNAF